MTLPAWSWTIDGKPFTLGSWQCGANETGYDRASGTVDEDTARRIKQGSRLVGYVNGRPNWDGRLAINPLVHRGVARLDATGHQSQAGKYRKRLLYQTRDYSQWSPADGDPYNRVISTTASQAKFDLQERGGSLNYRLGDGETFASGESHAFMMSARDAPGGITGYGFDWLSPGTIAIHMETYAWDWLNQNLLTIANPISLSGTSGSDTRTFAGRDQLEFQLKTDGGFTLAAAWELVLRNVRVNGRASGDSMTTSAIVTDLCGLLGFDSSLVQESGLDALPFDAIGSSALQAMEHMSMLDDRPSPFIGGDGSAIWCEYRPWDYRVWTVYLASDVQPDLARQEDFNEVRVTVPMVGGFDNEVTLTVEDAGLPDPLAENALRNTYEVDIPDVQADFTLAEAVANLYLPYVSSPRLQGRLRIIAAKGPGGINDAYGPIPGDTIRIADYGPAQSMDLRITSVQWSASQVDIGIEMDVRFGLLARRALLDARAPGTAVPERGIVRRSLILNPDAKMPRWMDIGAYRVAMKAWRKDRPKVHQKKSPGAKKVTPAERKAIRQWRRQKPKKKKFMEDY